MRLRIVKKEEMTRRDIPLLDYTRDMLKTPGAAAMLDRSFFMSDLKDGEEYIVMDLREYQRASPDNQERMWQLCEQMSLHGGESRARLEQALADCDTTSIAGAVDWVQEAFRRKDDEREEAFYRQQLQHADEQLADEGRSTALEDLLYNDYVCRPLRSERHRGFDELPLLDDRELTHLGTVTMPVYIVVDVSKSMLDEQRYLFARDIVTRMRQHLLTRRVTDDVRIVIYSDAAIEIQVEDDQLVRPRASTATGTALRFVRQLIDERHAGEPVYVALVTDGEPTTGGEHEGRLCEPQEHAELMAEQLPENAKLVQFALAPIDPADTRGFERYVSNIFRITERSPYGQTVVLLRDREECLPYLVLGGHQKSKQVQVYQGSRVV